jgi:GNAT superfamily N-acetyltransferase
LLKGTIDSENALVLLALNKHKEIIGTISGHAFDKPAVNIARVGVIYSLWVMESHRKQGVGLQLLNTLEDRLIEKGACAFQVGWDTGNTTAALWWQKRGYSPYEVIASKVVKPKN